MGAFRLFLALPLPDIKSKGCGMEINTIKALELLKKDQANEGKVFKVSKAVFEHYAALIKATQVTQAEIVQIEKVLGGKIQNGKQWGLSRTCTCPVCHHVFTFADHVQSALASGAHSVAEMLDFLNSNDYFLTIDTLKTRDISCTNCSAVIVSPHCCYKGSRYAYV